jgi:amino acid adenylation domain-containing protein
LIESQSRTQHPASNVNVLPHHAALLVFTSGSTGQPKGVLQEHRSIATSVRDHGAAMGITADARVLQFASFTFDTSFSDMFGTFAQGGCVCVPSEFERLNDLTGAIQRLNATLACLTPAVVDQLSPADVPSLHTLCVGGEDLTESIVERWAPAVTLINIYGITECTIWCITTNRIRIGDHPSNIGRANCGKTWVVAPHDYNELVPVGGVGELLIEGHNLAREYLHDPLRTRESFITNPAWSTKAGSTRRLYRTGDLVQYCFDGSVHFLGRQDSQVKINGQRVELSEIEYYLKKIYPQNAQLAVDIVVPLLENGRPRLMAFLKRYDQDLEKPIHKEDQIYPLEPSISQRLSSVLPWYMIPFAVLEVDQMPMTISGKLDRKTLRHHAAVLLSLYNSNSDGSSTDSLDLRVPDEAFTIMESRLRDLWASVLSVNALVIGRHSTFLHLGGDSVSAMKLTALARQNCLKLTVSDILSRPVLCEMALACGTIHHVDTKDPTPFGLLKNPNLRNEIQSLVDQPIQDAYPCTPIQEGLMALSLRRLGAYLAQAVVKLPPGTNLDQYTSAWQSVLRLNAILRTVIIDCSEGLVQVVLEKTPQCYRSGSLQSYLKEDSLRPMGLGDELSRIGFVSDMQGDFLVWTAHHSIFDGYSSELIFDQVNKHYSQISTASPPPYSRFIQFLGSSENEESEAFWRNYLENATSVSFPFNRPANYEAGATTVFQQAITFGNPQAQNITLASLIRASWLLLIAKYCATDDIVTAATLSGRSAPVQGVEAMTGPTITTVPIRVRLKTDDSVYDYLMRIQEESIAMIPHENFGLRRIRQLGSDAKAACEVQTHIVIHPYENKTLNQVYEDLHGQQSKGLAIGLSTYALTLEVQITPDGAQLALRYDKHIFDALEIKRLVDQLQNVTAQLAAADNRTLLSAIDFIGPANKLVLDHWQINPVQQVNGCVHHEIMRRATESPSSLAVQAWDGQLTYAELDKLSSRLAWNLMDSWNVVPETKVPMLFEKSFWTIVAVMGVMKAGGAFVTLDPSHPQSRLETILEDLGASLVISSTTNAKLAEKMTRPVLVVGADLFQNISMDISCPDSPVQPSDAVYVIYSSGTTGRPKGSVVEHRAYLSGALAHRHEYAINSHSRIFQFSSYSFDTCLADILTTLIVGGCICIPNQYERDNDLAGSINRLAANWAHITPSVADMISPEDVPCLETLLLGGEPMTDRHISKWKNHLKLINVFGPSECCVTCCANIHPGENQSLARNIGIPVGCHAWITDPQDPSSLAPIGAIGELLIEGPLVARGYLNEPKKTLTSFIPKPHWASEYGTPLPGCSLYRTSDLVRYASNGTLIYEGRRDSQIKLNGQRVELSEIEHVLRSLLPTSAIAVDVVSILREEKQLLAAFIDYQCEETNLLPTSNKSQTNPFEDSIFTRALKKDLERSLPKFMVPSIFLPLHPIPLTMSRKVDRRALRSMAQEIGPKYLSSQASHSDTISPPRTQIEADLIDICCHVLNMDLGQVGTNHSFLGLGADSVDVMRLVALSRRRNIELSVADVFKQPRIADMALVARNITQAVTQIKPFSLVQCEQSLDTLLRDAAEKCHIEPSEIENIYPCTPLQTGITALSLKDPSKFMSQCVWRLPRTIERARFRAAWELVGESFPILRTSIIYSNGTLLQVVRSKGIQWQEAGNLQTHLTNDHNCPMALGELLSRFAMAQDSEPGTEYFVLTIHHAVYDGWSIQLVLDEVVRIYHGSKPEPRPGFDLFLKYLAQLDQIKSEQFWHSQLQGCTAQTFPHLPSIGYQPHPRRNFQKNVQVNRLCADDVTLSTMIRATWALLVSQYTNQNDVLFGVTLTGRNAPVPRIEDIAGPTFATIPIRVQIYKDLTVPEFLHQLQCQSTDMIPHEQFGLLNIEGVAAKISASYQFQSLLIVQPSKSRKGVTTSSSRFLGLEQQIEDVSKFNNYSVMIQCTLDHRDVTIEANYDDLVLPLAQMERLIHQFSHVLQQLCSGEVRELDGIDYISPEDRIELSQWNNASLEPIGATICESFLRHVEQQPDVLAVTAWDGEWTYREVCQNSRLLTEHLKTLGVERGVLVPVCFTKSKWVVVAIMAVLLAGGGCVVLDPVNHPTERLLGIVREVDAHLVLCDPLSETIFISHSNLQTMCLSQTTFNSLPKVPFSHLPIPQANDPAFIIFTSGSTGRPKGIVHDHQAICSAIKPFSSDLRVGKHSRIFQWSAYAFDIAVIDTMAALLHGACLCIPSEESRINNVAGALVELRANWATFTPSFARHIDPTTIPQLQTVVLAGEAMTPSDIQQWRGHILFNGYGPAEASLCVSGRITAEQRTVTIGRPMASNAWIVQAANNTKLAPIGAIGQLIMEGPMVAAGYLHQSELSNQSFIQVPSWIPGQSKPSRAYKTGDLARYNADGSIEFLGRRDHQVKIRGQRFELEEVENAIRVRVNSMGAFPDIAAEVITPKDEGSMPQLVIFVSSKILESHETVMRQYADMVESLKNFLPEFMIPSALIRLSELPLTASGKVDRKHLRALGANMTRAEIKVYSSATENVKAKPLTPTEKQIAFFWAAAISISETTVGRNDSFVHLGGNSLNAIRAVALARDGGLTMNVSDIFSASKLSELASLVDSRNSVLELPRPSPQFSTLSGLDKDMIVKSAAMQSGVSETYIQNIYPCTPLQEGLWALSLSQPGSYIGQHVCRLSPSVDIERLQGALATIWNSIDIMKTIFMEFGGRVMQAVLSSDFCCRVESDLETYLETQRNRSVLNGSPTNEFALIQEQDGSWKYLVWTAHHATFGKLVYIP